jgi:hypothetical protein
MDSKKNKKESTTHPPREVRESMLTEFFGEHPGFFWLDQKVAPRTTKKEIRANIRKEKENSGRP